MADDLRRRILGHEFAAGSELDELRLARDYGVSRTPVREALKLLCHEGLLVGEPRRGLSIATVGEAEIAEARELLSLLGAGEEQHVPPTTGKLRLHLTGWLRQRLQLAVGQGCTPLAARDMSSATPQGSDG